MHFLGTQALEGQVGTWELRILEHLRHLDNLKALGYSDIQALGYFGIRALDIMSIQRPLGDKGKQVLGHSRIFIEQTCWTQIQCSYFFLCIQNWRYCDLITTGITNRILKFRNRDAYHFLSFREYYNFFSLFLCSNGYSYSLNYYLETAQFFKNATVHISPPIIMMFFVFKDTFEAFLLLQYLKYSWNYFYDNKIIWFNFLSVLLVIKATQLLQHFPSKNILPNEFSMV